MFIMASFLMFSSVMQFFVTVNTLICHRCNFDHFARKGNFSCSWHTSMEYIIIRKDPVSTPSMIPPQWQNFTLTAVFMNKNFFTWVSISWQLRHQKIMMTSSNGTIFRVTDPLSGEFTGPGEFPAQKPVKRSFDVFFEPRLNERLNKQPWGWWFKTPPLSLWRQCNVRSYIMKLFLADTDFSMDLVVTRTLDPHQNYLDIRLCNWVYLTMLRWLEHL